MKKRYFWMFCSVVFVVSMIVFPGDVFEAAKTGLKAWWEIVFPALLPFFIAAELLMGFGIVQFMGVLLEPVMRPLFNVPGSGSFVMAVGFTSGFPISSYITAQLRNDRLCTRIEAERLLCFTNNASPLFMLVAVSVGMFGDPALGLVIAGSHYMANLTLGLLLRFYGRHDREVMPAFAYPRDRLLRRAWQQLTAAAQKETRPVGKLFGDAVANSVNKLLAIGGFVIIFAVIIKILTKIGIMAALTTALIPLLSPLGFDPAAIPALSQGLFEVTLGTKAASDATIPFPQQVMAAAVCLAWSGLSVHAQVASMISNSDIRLLPFVLSRFGQAVLAALYSQLLLMTGTDTLSYLARPVFRYLPAGYGGYSWIKTLWFSSFTIIFIFVSLILLGVCLNLLRTKLLHKN